MAGKLGTYPISTELVYSLVFHTSTPLESTGLEHWKVFQMAKLGGKKIVDLVANRCSFNRNYWGPIKYSRVMSSGWDGQDLGLGGRTWGHPPGIEPMTDSGFQLGGFVTGVDDFR